MTALHHKLQRLYNNSKIIRLGKKDKYVIFSDLHMGNGGRNDDFLKNAELFKYILKNYYSKNGFKLILNGDIEELQRFSMNKINNKWGDIFDIFDMFNEKSHLLKIYGNHDIEVMLLKHLYDRYDCYEGIRLEYKNDSIFIFHGHQANALIENYNHIVRFFLRYFANILGIRNYSFSHDNKRRMALEQKIYDFSRRNKLITIIGHTHRPLFESLSKIDILKFKIEKLCRKYVKVKKSEKKKIEKNISKYKNALFKFSTKEIKNDLRNSIYASNIVLPCLFNSGCCIGKRGITSVEIVNDEIFLIHWFDKAVKKKYLYYNKYKSVKLNDSNYYRQVLNKDHLDYIFTRIKLLS